MDGFKNSTKMKYMGGGMVDGYAKGGSTKPAMGKPVMKKAMGGAALPGKLGGSPQPQMSQTQMTAAAKNTSQPQSVPLSQQLAAIKQSTQGTQGQKTPASSATKPQSVPLSQQLAAIKQMQEKMGQKTPASSATKTPALADRQQMRADRMADRQQMRADRMANRQQMRADRMADRQKTPASSATKLKPGGFSQQLAAIKQKQGMMGQETPVSFVPKQQQKPQQQQRGSVDLRDERYRNDLSPIRNTKLTEGRDFIKDPNTGRRIELDNDGFEIINSKINSGGVRGDPRKRPQQMPAASATKPQPGSSSQQFAAKMIGQKTPVGNGNIDPRMKKGGLAVMPKKGKR
jgi:hypothetical protein